MARLDPSFPPNPHQRHQRTMPLVQECSDFDFHDNQITIVGGSQYNTTHIIHDNRVQAIRQERRELTIWDEYERVRTGDVNLTKVVGTSDICDDPSSWTRKAVACRTISVARIRGEDREAEFLYVGYSGPKALEAFKQDFHKFSAIRHPNVAQLFGYNDSQYNLPALIFYDALIPLGRVLSTARNPLARLLKTYFSFQLGISRMIDGGRSVPSEELWIEPRSGALRRGPSVKSDALWLGPLSNAPSTTLLDPLSIQTYSDMSTVADYLLRVLPTDITLEEIIQRRRWPSIHNKRLTLVDAWSYLASSIWKRNQRDIIARWTGIRETPRYVFKPSWTNVHVINDGSVRLRFTDLPAPKDHWYRSELFDGLDIRKAWLVQAHSVFGQLGIHEKEWEEYSLTRRVYFYLRCTEAHTYQQENTDTASNQPTPYLFIRPIPHLSDDEVTWRAWAERGIYFWSFDPFGQEQMSESMRISLGLPSFTIEVVVHGYSWNLDEYKTLERLHISRGFDPKTTDYACSLGYPLMQVMAAWHWKMGHQ
ncbi:hypothetical protein WG66_001539 [Moniliophthora roreri]|nr:hypothetical protein WG66_001539 [Moniliophthora roreri]